MVKIGIIGVGHLGKIHLKCLLNIPEIQVAGFYDINPEVCSSIEKEFGLKAYSSADELIKNVDAVDIVTPTVSHYSIAALALRASKHVFLEKPLVATSEEASKLAVFAREANVVIQVGHVERFNPAFIAAKNQMEQPVYISAKRTSSFNSRGTEVSVVLDLMIHDIDLVQSLIKANIKKIYATGVSILSDSADTANARIVFDNGSVADFFVSRIAQKAERNALFYGRNSYMTVDFLEKTASSVRFAQKEKIKIEQPYTGRFLYQLNNPGMTEIPVVQNNAIEEELKAFANAIENGTAPPVTFTDGLTALETAIRVNEQVNETIKILK